MCIVKYYVQLVYIFTVIWSKVALKSGLPFDLDKSGSWFLIHAIFTVRLLSVI